MEPKANDIWETNEGRLVLIIEVPEHRVNYLAREAILPEPIPMRLGILWYDDIDKTFVASEILNRLKVKRDDISQAEWFRQAIIKVS